MERNVKGQATFIILLMYLILKYFDQRFDKD
jgi:hypothetical protein